MLKTKVNQAIVSTFTSEKPRAEDVHQTRYSVTLSMTPDEHKDLAKRLIELTRHMIGPSLDAAISLLTKESERTPSTHSGLISVDCWGEDQSFSGLLMNGELYPYSEDNPPRVIVLTDVDVGLTSRVMTKKDKTVVLAWTCHTIDQSGPQPKEKDDGKDKKR